eukprot:UN1932
MAWALAVLGKHNRPLMASIASESRKMISEFNSQNLSNTVWAFATLGFPHVPLRDAIASASLPRLPEADAQDLANTAWAMAVFGVGDTPLMASISSHAINILRRSLAGTWALGAALGAGNPLTQLLAGACLDTCARARVAVRADFGVDLSAGCAVLR